MAALSTRDVASAPLIIDSSTTLDRDDALWVTRTADGHWHARVLIADVAQAIAPDTRADHQAYSQVATIYLPEGRSRPMLPPAAGAQPLAAGHACPVLAIDMLLTPEGSLADVTLRRDIVTTGVVLTYTEAAAALDDASGPLHLTLRDAFQLANILLARRRARGALALYDLLHGWATTEEGQLYILDTVHRNAGYLIVQEFMIAANEAMARYAAERSVALLFRNHAASPLAPSREHLQADLASLGVVAPVDPLTVASRLQLLVKPASYDATITGHYGLNLPFYTHATSPLRRYADLINQRILAALVDGHPVPYGHDQLTAIATHINAIDRERKERRAERNAEANRQATRALMVQVHNAGTYQALDPDAFHKALKLAIAEARHTDGLLAEIERRLTAGLLAARDLHRLLFMATGVSWEALRQQALAWIADHPEVAVSVLDIERATRQWTPIAYREARSGTDHAPVFRATAELHTDHGPASGVARVAGAKKDARQQAVVSLLATLLAVRDPSRDAPVVDDAPTVSPVPTAPHAASGAPGCDVPPAHDATSATTTTNAISVLNQYAQQHRLALPHYTFEQSGPDHMPTFTCSATITLPGGALAASGLGRTKPEAKAVAAARLWQEIASTSGRAG